MKTKTFLFALLATLLSVGAMADTPTDAVADATAVTEAGTDAVKAGAQVKTEAALVSGKAYLLYYAGGAYMKDTGSQYAGQSDTDPTKNAIYTLTKDDGTWTVQNYVTGKYWGQPTAKSTGYIGSDEAGRWTLNFQSNGNLAPSCNGYSWNRSNGALHPWDEGTANANQFRIYEVEGNTNFLPELNHLEMSVADEAAPTLQTGQWYVMFDRGADHGYLYEDAATHTLYNTATRPGAYAPQSAKYLIRIVGENGTYYLQTGLGNYFGTIAHEAAVKTTAIREQRIGIGKIAETDGHFCLTSAEGVVLDANDLSLGDGTVVGYGTTVPTTVDGNSDWAFYPVALRENPNVALYADGFSIQQAYQTTGRGNERALLLRITLSPLRDATDATLNVTLKDQTQTAATAISVYELASKTPEFYAQTLGEPLATASDLTAGTVALNIGNLTADTPRYLWLTASVKDDAPLGAVIDVAATSLAYTCNGTQQILDFGIAGDPEEQGAKVFDVQQYVFLPGSFDSKVYRIPALATARDGSLVAAVDKRYDSYTDIGNGHIIDIVISRSTDGGRTWSTQQTIAKGDNSSDATCGYGDPSLTLGPDGRLYCLFAAGNTGFMYGLNRIALSTSSDNGLTWTAPVDLYAEGRITDHNETPLFDYFVTSGKGLYTSDGVLMYLLDAQQTSGGAQQNYVFYSTDDGATWHIDNTLVCTGANEAKLEQMNDGSLIASIRTNGNRAFNRGTYVKNDDGTCTFTWGAANAELTYAAELRTGSGNNQDILYYSREGEGQPDILLHTMTAGSHANLKLFMSLNQGQTWQEVMQMQPGGARYAVMTRLQNGDLGILFEDGALGQNTPTNAENTGYQYPINFITLTREQLTTAYEDLVEAAEEADTEIVTAKVAYGTTDPSTFGGWGTSGWHQSGTSNAASGIVGLKLESSYSSAFNRANGIYDKYVLALKVSATGATDDITLTAPEGYVIVGYQLDARSYNGGKDYTLTAGETTLTTASGSWQTFRVSGLSDQTTTFTVTTAQDQTNYLCISDFTVTLAKEGIALTDVKVANADATAYGTLATNTWTAGSEAGVEGLKLSSADITLTTPTAWYCTVLGLKVNNDNGATGTLRMEAPEGYLIAGYQAEVQNWSSGNSFTLTPVEGTGSAVTVTNHSGTTALQVSGINSNLAHLTVTATAQTNPVCFKKLIVTLYNTNKAAKTITYAIVDAEGNVVTQVENVGTYVGYVPILPDNLDKRPWCTYDETFYKDAACTKEVTKIHSSNATLYSKYAYNGPVEFSTESNPKWYILHSYGTESSEYYLYNQEKSLASAQTKEVMALYDDKAYHWALIGNPYAAKLLSRTGGYLSAAATTAASNGTAIPSAIGEDSEEYPYQAFSLYGAVNDYVSLPANTFALALNGSEQKTWVDGADAHRIVYHGDITVNDNLQINNWLKANLQPIELPTTYDIALTTVGEESYATLHLPFGITLPEEVKAYKIGVSGQWAIPTEIGEEVPALTPVVLYSGTGATEVKATLNPEAEADNEGNLLAGTLVKEHVEGYVLNSNEDKVGFYRLSESGELEAYRAYLPATDAGDVKGLLLKWDGETDGVEATDMVPAQAQTLYNLAGQRLTSPTKAGIYIVNGKKIVIK